MHPFDRADIVICVLVAVAAVVAVVVVPPGSPPAVYSSTATASEQEEPGGDRPADNGEDRTGGNGQGQHDGDGEDRTGGNGQGQHGQPADDENGDGETAPDADNGTQHPGNGSDKPEPGAVEPVDAEDYDPPPGDGQEHPEEVDLAIDGDPGTAWQTERYGDGIAATGKSGVGLAVDAGRSIDATALVLMTDTPGFGATIHAADRDFHGWGQPVGRVGKANKRDSITLDLKRPERFYLVWITDLHGREDAQLNEVRLRTRR